MCSYFGNVYISEFKNHAEEIRSHGFDTIVHPVTEIDVKMRGSNIQELIETTKELGFTCVVSPASIGNLFGYGNSSPMLTDSQANRIVNWDGSVQNIICPCASTEFREIMRELMDLCKGADWIMWDEPDMSPCYCDKCVGKVPMLSFLTRGYYYTGANNCFTGVGYARSLGMKSTVCFWGGRIHPETYDIARVMDDIGVSVPPEYYLKDSHVLMWLTYVDSLKAINNSKGNRTSSVWFPSYNVPAEFEDYIGRALQMAKDCKIDNVATWGFRGCEAWGYARCERPDVMWEETGKAFNSFDL